MAPGRANSRALAAEQHRGVGRQAAIVEEPADIAPDAAQVYAIGPAGEVGVISRWLSAGEANAVASHIIVTGPQRGAVVPA